MTSPNSYLDEHEEMALLLPWYVNDSLEDGESARVRAHLGHCLTCRRELSSLRSLAISVAEAPTLDLSAQSSYARFMRQLPPKTALGTPVAAAPVRRVVRRRFRPALRVFAAAAMLMLLALPFGLGQFGATWQPDFRTLSDARPVQEKVSADLRLVFSKPLPDGGIDALLREVGGKVVDGPNAAGAYAVRLGEGGKPADPEAALAFLRRQDGIMLAEPILKAN